MSRNKNLAVIPARGGSKRIPKKNIRKMLNLPMIGYTIQAAIESGLFDRVIVSTDCHDIANISKELGADVPFMRDASIADDITPISAATLDALCKIDPNKTKYKYICQLMANCPMRDAKTIKSSFQHFIKHNAPAQISVTKYGWLNPWWAMEMDEGKPLNPIFPEKLKERSQDLPALYCPTGAVWWAKCDTLRKEKTFHCPEKIGFELDWKEAVDIDDEEDWGMAEFLLTQKHLKNK